MRYDVKPLVEECVRVDISSSIRKSVLDLTDTFESRFKHKLNLQDRSDVDSLVGLINTSLFLKQSRKENGELIETKLNEVISLINNLIS